MASDNVELFRRGVRAWSDFDEETALELTGEDIEFHALRSATEGPYRGHEGVRAFFADNRESFEVFSPSYDDVRDLGDGRVIALGSIRVRGKGSGVEIDVPSAVIVEIRDGRFVFLRDYGDREAALEAAGLT
jgi:ketosteroid isomerase-like protein